MKEHPTFNRRYIATVIKQGSAFRKVRVMGETEEPRIGRAIDERTMGPNCSQRTPRMFQRVQKRVC